MDSSNHLTRPTYCNQGRCNEKAYIGLVEVMAQGKKRRVSFGSVCDVGKGGKYQDHLKVGVQFIRWCTWCVDCWEQYQEDKQIRSAQAEMEV